MTDKSEHAPHDRENTAPSEGFYDDARQRESADALSLANYDALTDEDEDAVDISEGDGPFLEASDDPIAGATLRKKK
jgi:hypothetical protein